MENSEQPAFPPSKSNLGMSVDMKGLTKREYFAVIVLQGLISGYTNSCKVNEAYIPFIEHKELVKHSIEITEELLKQLKL